MGAEGTRQAGYSCETERKGLRGLWCPLWASSMSNVVDGTRR